MAAICEKDACTQMKIGLSLETTLKLRDTWHAAINHEWYDFLQGHTICPLIPYDQYTATDYDLIILCGGNDMATIKTWRNNNDPVRDRFETELVSSAINNSVPIVGICRGFHFLNEYLGGTLALMEKPYDGFETTIKYQNMQTQITCHHSIAVDNLASGFEVLAKDTNGIIELVHNQTQRVLGIGWHPERAVNAHTRNFILNLMKNL